MWNTFSQTKLQFVANETEVLSEFHAIQGIAFTIRSYVIVGIVCVLSSTEDLRARP